MTPDPDAAAAFYGAVVGWTIGAAAPVAGDIDYRMIGRADGGFAGGVLTLSTAMVEQGTRPCWMPYLHVIDVDVAVAAMAEDGAHVLMPPADLEVGRIAMLADPQGVPFYVMAPVPVPGREGERSDVFSPDAVQHVRWNELASPDQAGAQAFYTRHFGFVFDEAMDMGELGEYRFIDHAGLRVGAIWQSRNPDQPSLWTLYFGVPSITAAAEAVVANGGQVFMGPHEVPGGDWIVLAADPQGAAFGLVGPQLVAI
nr:VOC family protein [Novosphingobium sp. 9]